MFILLVVLALLSLVKCDCPMPQAPANGDAYLTRGPNSDLVEEFETVDFECESDYVLNGSDQIRCVNGTFTSAIPTCVRIKCPPLPQLDHGDWRFKFKLHTENTWVRASCDVNFKLTNPAAAKLKCKRNGTELEWWGVTPVCIERIHCGDPGVSPNGTNFGLFYEGDIVTYECDQGFELVGSRVIECGSNGSWSQPRPRCKPPIHCPDPEFEPFRIISGPKTSDYFVPNDNALVSCELGYRVGGDGVDYYTCLEGQVIDGEVEEQIEPEWDGVIPPCEEIFCGTPKPPRNGFIRELVNDQQNLTNFPFAFEITFECNEGYRLIGGSWTTCQNLGWEGKTPFCREVRCSNPGTPENGLKTGSTHFKIGEKIKFGCFTGFELQGSEERTCLENGKWNGELAKCFSEATYCPDPGTPESGSKLGSDYNLDSVVTFVCDIGFTLIGSNIRQCQSDRTWNGTQTICRSPLAFDRPPEASYRLLFSLDKEIILQNTNADNQIVQSGPLQLGRSLDIGYTAGNLVIYFVFDSSGSIGETNFNSSIEFAKALVRRIGVSRDGARFGAITYGDSVKVIFNPYDYQTTQPVIDKFNRVKYSGGGTATSDALKHILTQMMPLTTKQLKNPKSIVFLITDGNPNIGGNPQPVVSTMKKHGVKFFCIAVSGKRKMDLKSLQQMASDPNDVYQLHTYGALNWMVDDVLKGSIDYSRCGVPVKKMEPVGKLLRVGVKGEPVQTYWPWMAALYLKTPGRRHELRCGGSLIASNWVLTAAHCLQVKHQDEQYLFSVNDVIVKLGLTDVRNESLLQESYASELHRHPKWELASFDYDVALIKLENNAILEKEVRTVCLSPATKDLSEAVLYQPGNRATVIGYGKTPTVDTMSDHLRKVSLTIQSNGTCRQSLIKTNNSMTGRMFCAGDGTGVNEDTCSGDSGGPLMQYVNRADEEGYWVQIGIVSWGIHDMQGNCGVNGSYGFYTKVSDVVEWVNEIIHNN